MATDQDSNNTQSRLPLYISLGVLTSLVLSYFFWPAFGDFICEAYRTLTSGNEERISTWVEQAGFWGPLLIIGLMVIQMFLIVVPSPLLMIVSVLAYGPWWGSAISLAGVFVASSIGYVIGAWLGPYTVNKLIGEKTEKRIEHYIEKIGFWAIVIARLSPLFSNDATSFVGGLLRMGYIRFMAATMAGITPLAIAIAYMGSDIERLKSGLIWISIAGVIALVGYVVYEKKAK